MDDSSMSMQWAMETLQHEQPPPAAAPYAVLQELLQNSTATAGAAAAAQDCAIHSWSPGVGGSDNMPGGTVVENDGWPSSYPPVTWNFASTMPQPAIHDPGSVYFSSRGTSAGMDDSSMFMQWAMDTLQHEQPPAAAPYAQELLQNGTATAGAAAAAQDCAIHSWSTGDGGRDNMPGGAVVENDGWPSSYPPVTCNFASTMPQPAIHDEATPTAPAKPTDSSPEPCVQEHVIAERKRRDKISRNMIQLATVIPGLKKMDKVTILSAAVRYVKEQQEKIRELEGTNVRSVDSVLHLKRPDATATTGSSLPEIHVRVSERNVIVTIHCKNGKGVLVRLLAEVEGLRLRIRHTNVIPFPACTMNITISAKVDEGFNIAPEDIVGKLDAALR